MTESIDVPRQALPLRGTYMLDGDPEHGIHPQDQVREVVHKFGIVRFIQELAGEIEAVYTEPGVVRSRREEGAHIGGDSGYETFETMVGGGSDYTIWKEIGSDPDNHSRGLQTVWGRMTCIETATNRMHLMCDASFLTMLRTATTSSLVLNKLKPELEGLAVVGAGIQGQSTALTSAILSPDLKTILVRDKHPDRAQKAAQDLPRVFKDLLGNKRAAEIKVEAVEPEDKRVELEPDAIVTATFGLPTEPPVLAATELRPELVIAAIGADMVGKRELEPVTYDYAKFVTDELRQSLREGELQHAVPRIGIAEQDINDVNSSSFHGSLLGGRVIGITELLKDGETFATRPEPITIYDSTGFAGQDLAAARLMLRALQEVGYQIDQPFNGTYDPERRRNLNYWIMGEADDS